MECVQRQTQVLGKSSPQGLGLVGGGKAGPLGGGFQVQHPLVAFSPSSSQKTPIRELKGKCKTNKNEFFSLGAFYHWSEMIFQLSVLNKT